MDKAIIYAMIVIAFVSFVAAAPQSTSLTDLDLVSLIVLRRDAKEGYSVDFISSSESSEQNSEMSFSCLSSKGSSIAECIFNAENETGNTMFFGHTKSVFFEKSFFDDPENLNDFIAFSKRNTYFNHYISLYVIDDPVNNLKSFIDDKNEETADFLRTVVKKYPTRELLTVEFSEITCKNRQHCLPLLTAKGKVAFSGICAVKNGAFAVEYDREKESFYKVLADMPKGVFLDMPFCSMEIVRGLSRLKYLGDKKFRYEINLSCELSQNKLTKLDTMDGEEEELEKKAAEYLSHELEDFLEELKKDKVDITGVTDHLYRFENKEYEKLLKQYDDIFEHCDIEVDVCVNIVRNELNRE